MEEIRRSPVEVGSLSHYLQGLIHLKGGFLTGFNHHPRISLVKLGRIPPWLNFQVIFRRNIAFLNLVDAD